MSKLFKYSTLKDTVNFDGFLPGQKSRASNVDTIYAGIAEEVLENGQIVHLHRDKDDHGTLGLFAKPIESEEDLDAFGVVLQDVKAQELRFGLGTQLIYDYPENRAVSVLTKGYVWVPVQDTGSVLAGNPVYVRVAKSESNPALPVGGVETALIEDETVLLPNAKFTGAEGFPLSGTNNGSTELDGLTGRTAEIVIEIELI